MDGAKDAVLIEAPGDKRVLIDAGTAGSKVADKLLACGITPEPRGVHAPAWTGGMADVLKNIEVGGTWTTEEPHDLTYSRTMGVERKGIGTSRL